MSTTHAAGADAPRAPGDTLAYDVFVNDPPPQDGVLPNGEPKRFSPMASTLIYGRNDAVLTDPGMTADQAEATATIHRALDLGVRILECRTSPPP